MDAREAGQKQGKTAAGRTKTWGLDTAIPTSDVRNKDPGHRSHRNHKNKTV